MRAGRRASRTTTRCHMAGSSPQQQVMQEQSRIHITGQRTVSYLPMARHGTPSPMATVGADPVRICMSKMAGTTFNALGGCLFGREVHSSLHQSRRLHRPRLQRLRRLQSCHRLRRWSRATYAWPTARPRAQAASRSCMVVSGARSVATTAGHGVTPTSCVASLGLATPCRATETRTVASKAVARYGCRV